MSYIYNLGIDFYQISSKLPTNIALICNNEEYTYTYLNKLSNQIAHYLISKGLKKGDVAGIFHNKTVLGFSFMLACLKMGVIYVNLDYHSPNIRLEKIIKRSKPKIILNSFDSNEEVIFSIVAITCCGGSNCILPTTV